MKGILFFVILACVLAQVCVGQKRVLQNPDRSFVTEDLQMKRKDTGIMVESGLELSRSQLEKIIQDGEEIPLDKKRVLVGWNKPHTYLVYETRSTERAKLMEDGVIRLVPQETVTTEEAFNPFFSFAGVYVLLMALAIVAVRKFRFTLATAIFVAATPVLATATLVLATAALVFAITTTFTTFVILTAIFATTLATYATITTTNVKKVTVSGVVGIGLMIIASVAMWFI